METLTISEMDILVEALTAWETKDASSEMVGSLITGLLMPKDAREDPKFIQEEELRKSKTELATATRKEASIMLKAKLLTLKTQMIADTL